MPNRLAIASGLAFIAALLIASSRAASPVTVMLLDGESGGAYHDWPRVTPVLKAMLDETGLFATTVVTAPPPGADFSGFAPEFSRYQVLVMNYDAPDERWPPPLKASFERFVAGGGGLVTVHAADNAFPGWQAYNEMIGVGGWRGRNEQAGPRWLVRNGTLVSDPSPGPAGSHGSRLPFLVRSENTSHPIMRGLPPAWIHQGDELYARLRGPGRNMTVLASAYSDPRNAGSGSDEPQLLVVDYGQGRVFHTTWGHDIAALASVDFVVTFQRGTEWAATGRVTQQLPRAFPTATTVSYRVDLAEKDRNFAKGLDVFDVDWPP